MEAFVKDGMLRVGNWQLQAPVRLTITDLQQASNPNKEKNQNKSKQFRRMAAEILFPASFPELIENMVSIDSLVGRKVMFTETP
jgi:hypothetical protein